MNHRFFAQCALFTFTVLTIISCGGVPDPVKKPSVPPPVEKSEGPELIIGDQTWTKANLDVATFRNGDPIPEVQNDEDWEQAAITGQPAFCYYDNDPANGKRYGKLYNFYAATDPRGIAPQGWHLPTAEEWNVLKARLGGLPTVGVKLKSSTGWEASGNGTDDVGFNGLPGGARGVTSGFKGKGRVAVYWSSTEKSANFGIYRVLHATRTDLYEEDDYKGSGFAIRCVKD